MLPYTRKDALWSPVHTVSTQENFIDVPERIDILGRVAVYNDYVGLLFRFQRTCQRIDAQSFGGIAG